MKSVLVAVFTFSFAAVALFGFFAMNHTGIVHGAGCIVEKIQGSVCPTAEENALGFVSFHLNIIKNFSAAFSNTALFLAVLAALALALVILIFPALGPTEKKINRASFCDFQCSGQYLRKKKVGRWLSFHETSPTSD